MSMKTKKLNVLTASSFKVIFKEFIKTIDVCKKKTKKIKRQKNK